ncbi:GNAT family N-acetyltransferase [Streptomyces pseudovenezuelae]|uniref:GNAT family N-acetyltransferase n=1 Tax=Streptomyces pseudovenezuelae TaxID=67350 RepID=UPI0036E65930
MTELDAPAWPLDPIRTERLVLRASEARDRAAFIELYSSPEVHTYLGGPRPRDELDRSVPEIPGRRPGNFVIELDGAMIGTVEVGTVEVGTVEVGTVEVGTVEVGPREAERHGRVLPDARQVRPDAGEAELSYLLLPKTWGRGYAAEACAAALDWFADAVPGVPVVLYTQTANTRSMRLAAKLGFTEVRRFEQWDAEQWMGVWEPAAPPT